MSAWVLKHRVSVTLVLGGLLVLATARYAPRDTTGIPTDLFWEAKMNWRACADCVLAGDSRMYMGVSPAAMQAHLPDARILNFGFTAAGFRDTYLERIPQVLDPHSIRPTIVLGITPMSLTDRPTANSEFERRLCSRRPPPSPLDLLAWHCRPFSLANLAAAILPQCQETHYYQRFHADGWVAAHHQPAAPALSLPKYRRTFRRHQVDPRMLANLLAHVEKWTAQGIAVYGFRPPTTREMVRLENDLSGFNEADLVQRFEQAGGVWLPVAPHGYASFDGSHLRWDAAIDFSHNLAQALRATPAAKARLASSTPPGRR